MSNSTQNEVLYIAWWCPHKPLGHFVCKKATQRHIDEHLATHTNDHVPDSSKMIDRALQDVSYWINELIEKRCDRVYCRMKIEEIQAKERADARKEVIRRIEVMPDKDVRPEITVWLESKEYCLGYNEALKDVLATLREEEK